MSDPQEKAASGEEGTGSEATAHLSSHPQQVQGEAPVASLQTPAAPATEDEESDDESEILEESPCGRWQKRKEEVTSFILMLNTSLITVEDVVNVVQFCWRLTKSVTSLR